MCNLPPCTVLTAKQNNVDGSGLPSILNVAKEAACPSIGCEHLRSTEYSCIAPTTFKTEKQIISHTKND